MGREYHSTNPRIEFFDPLQQTNTIRATAEIEVSNNDVSLEGFKSF